VLTVTLLYEIRRVSQAVTMTVLAANQQCSRSAGPPSSALSCSGLVGRVGSRVCRRSRFPSRVRSMTLKCVSAFDTAIAVPHVISANKCGYKYTQTLMPLFRIMALERERGKERDMHGHINNYVLTRSNTVTKSNNCLFAVLT